MKGCVEGEGEYSVRTINKDYPQSRGKEHESGGKKVFFVGAQMSADDYVLARDEPSIHRGIKY